MPDTYPSEGQMPAAGQMPYWCSAEGLTREISSYRQKMQPIFARWLRAKAAYATPAYRGEEGVPEPENYRMTFMVHTTARVMSGEPRVLFSTRRDVAQDRVEGLEAACDAWQRDQRYSVLRERALADMHLYDFAVYLVEQKTRRGFKQIKTPCLSRIPSHLFGCDTACTGIENARMLWHTIIEDHTDLTAKAQKDKSWNFEAVMKLTADALSDLRPTESAVKRGEVAYNEVYCPNYELPESDPFWDDMDEAERKRFNGTIFTVPHMQTGMSDMYLRDPRPYFGPRGGMYAIGGVMSVPDEWRPVSTLTACEGQIEQVNAQARANDKSARNKKSMVLVDAMNADGQAAIIAASDGDVVGIPGLSKDNVISVSAGGIDPESRVREVELRQRVERNLALGDATQGQAQSDVTATADAIAAQATANVSNFLDRKFSGWEREVFYRVAWYFDQDYRSGIRYDGTIILGGTSRDEKAKALAMSLADGMISPEEAQQAAQALAQMPDEPAGSPDDLDLHVDSTRKDGTEIQKMTLESNLLLAWGQALPLTAGFSPGMRKMFERWGEACDSSEMGQVFDFGAAAKVGEDMMKAQAEPVASTPVPAKTGAAPQKPPTTSKPGGGPQKAA